jgi:hypothetical protein
VRRSTSSRQALLVDGKIHPQVRVGTTAAWSWTPADEIAGGDYESVYIAVGP